MESNLTKLAASTRRTVCPTPHNFVSWLQDSLLLSEGTFGKVLYLNRYSTSNIGQQCMKFGARCQTNSSPRNSYAHMGNGVSSRKIGRRISGALTDSRFGSQMKDLT